MPNYAPLLSLIFPVYNSEEHVILALSSITKHIDNTVEIIIIDDGSTDNTPSLIHHYLQQNPIRNRYIQQQHKGVAEARNTGLKNATGDYIAFIDADDIVHEHYLNVLLPRLISRKFDLLDFKQARFYSSPPTIDIIPDEVKSEEYDTKSDSQLRLKPIFQRSHWHLVTRVFKKELIKDEIFDEGRRYEDMAFTPFQYLKQIKLLQLDCTLYFYRQNNDGITNNVIPQDPLDILYAMDKMAAYLQQYPNNKILTELATYMMLNCFSEARKAFRKVYGYYNYDENSISSIKNAVLLCQPSITTRKQYYQMYYPKMDMYFSQFKWMIKRLFSH